MFGGAIRNIFIGLRCDEATRAGQGEQKCTKPVRQPPVRRLVRPAAPSRIRAVAQPAAVAFAQTAIPAGNLRPGTPGAWLARDAASNYSGEAALRASLKR